jgi:hypothetical protein
VSADAVVHLDNRRHGALSKAGNSANGELLIGGGEQELVGFIAIVFATIKTEP